MPKIVKPTVPATVGLKTAVPGAAQTSLRAALQSIEDQRREGKTDAQEALKDTFDTYEAQRRAGGHW